MLYYAQEMYTNVYTDCRLYPHSQVLRIWLQVTESATCL